MNSTRAISSLILVTSLAALSASFSLQAECRAGAYTILSGDTLEYQGERMLLKGVLAPKEGEPYADASEKALQSLIVMNCPVSCFVSGRSEEGVALAVCYGGEESGINAAMIRQGFAKADHGRIDA